MLERFSIMVKFCLFLSFIFLSVHTFAQTFRADRELVLKRDLRHAELYEKMPNPPYLAVYQKGNKTLVVLAAKHGAVSIPAVQYAFDVYTPQIVLAEREPGEEFGPCSSYEDGYTAALAGKHKVPLVRADVTLEQQWQFAQTQGFSYEDWQMLWIIREAYYRARETEEPFTARQAVHSYAKRDHHPAWGTLFTPRRLEKYFSGHYKQEFNRTDFIKLFQDLMNVYPEQWVTQTPFYRLEKATSHARSLFMLENIAAALNRYDVVFIEMGAGHYLDLVPALQEMLGTPEITASAQLPPQQLWKDCRIDALEEIILVK